MDSLNGKGIQWNNVKIIYIYMYIVVYVFKLSWIINKIIYYNISIFDHRNFK